MQVTVFPSEAGGGIGRHPSPKFKTYGVGSRKSGRKGTAAAASPHMDRSPTISSLIAQSALARSGSSA